MLDHLDTSELTPDEIATIQFARELLAANPRIGKGLMANALPVMDGTDPAHRKTSSVRAWGG